MESELGMLQRRNSTHKDVEVREISVEEESLIMTICCLLVLSKCLNPNTLYEDSGYIRQKHQS